MLALKSLHLEYRLWIAELNFYINLIRIFNDRMDEIETEFKTEEIKITAGGFEKRFIDTRAAIDDLRHRMHIEKMSLTAMTREKTAADFKIDTPENYDGIRKDFFAFRIHFSELQTDFLLFENKPI